MKPMNFRSSSVSFSLRHSAVDRDGQLIQLDRFDEVVARIEAGGEGARARIGRPGDHDRPACADGLALDGVEGLEHAEVKNQDLPSPKAAQRAACFGVETEAAKAPSGDLGQSR